MTITYTNEKGTLKLYGDGNHAFNICEVSGLEPPTKVRHLESYISEDGCIEASSQYNQRIITVSGDVKSSYSENGTTDAPTLLKNAAKILCKKGSLAIEANGIKRKINVNEATLTIGKRYRSLCTFVIQMTCDYPHFSDILPTDTTIFKINKFLTKDSVFPLVLSERISEGIIQNLGDTKNYPVIAIRKFSDTAGVSTIKITNKTTGKSIVFNKSVALGEEIIIDIYRRTVTSSIDNNIINNLDRFYSLSDMWLEEGENVINVTIGGLERGIEVIITTSNEYTEAI